MYKKLLISLVLLGFLVSPVVHAQYISQTDLTNQLASLKQELITRLEAEIATLQSEINSILLNNKQSMSAEPSQPQTIEEIQQNLQPLENVPNVDLPSVESTTSPSN